MKEKIFTSDNFNSLSSTCTKISNLCAENIDGNLMTIQIICLGEAIKEFIDNPIIKNSGIK